MKEMSTIKIKDFTPEESLRFIKMVSDNPCLYNPADMSFNDVLLRDSIWEGIAQNFNKTAFDCKKAWRYLKDSYIRNKTKYIRAGRGSNHMYQQMSFLDGIVPSKPRGQKTWNRSNEPEKSAKNPIVVGIEHIVFNRPIDILNRRRQTPKSEPITKRLNWNKCLMLNNETNTVNVEEVHNEESRAETSLPTLEVTQNEAKTSLPTLEVTQNEPVTSLPTLEVTQNEAKTYLPTLEVTQNEPVTSLPTPEVAQNEAETSLPTLEVAQNEAVSRIAIKHPHPDEEQCSSSKVPKINNEDNKPKEDTSITFFALHVKETLNKLPSMLQIQAKQELFRVLTKYEIMAVNESDLPKENQIQISDKIPPQDVCVEVKVESNVYDDLIEFKEECVPDAN